MPRKDSISYIDFNEDNEDPLWCPYCEKVGLKIRLQQLQELEPGMGAPDIDNYLYCPTCKRTVPIYATKPDVDYGPVVDLVETHFDVGSKFASPKYKKKKRRRKMDSDTKDVFAKDMAAEKGNINILSDSQGIY